jgi:hypothetical protein
MSLDETARIIDLQRRISDRLAELGYADTYYRVKVSI